MCVRVCVAATALSPTQLGYMETNIVPMSYVLSINSSMMLSWISTTDDDNFVIKRSGPLLCTRGKCVGETALSVILISDLSWLTSFYI